MQRSVINTFPSSDPAFRRAVDTLVHESATPSAAELADRLRPLFPKVAVFERQLAGEHRRLYAYRDGHYQATADDRWWEAAGVAGIHISGETGRITSVSGSWADLMAARPEELLGRHFSEFVLPEAQPAARGMFEAVTQEREVRSQALLIRPDRSTVLIEFRATPRDGEIEIHYRAIDGQT